MNTTTKPITAAQNKTPGVQTFYYPSESEPDVTYSVQFVRRNGMRRWGCQCLNFFHVKQVRKRHCKHCRKLCRLSVELGGIRNLTAAVRQGLITVEVPA